MKHGTTVSMGDANMSSLISIVMLKQGITVSIVMPTKYGITEFSDTEA